MIPCHCHSEFSALDGASTCDEIADRLVELGLSGCALTDHGLVAGHRAFDTALRERGLKPLYGLEAYQAKTSRLVKPEAIQYVDKDGNTKTKVPRDAAHLILLAKNEVGLRNLNILSDESNRTGYYYSPRLDWELLEKYNEGIIATSACLSGLVSRGLDTGSTEDLLHYREIFGEDFYIEIHTYAAEKQRRVNQELVSLAHDLSIPLVWASDSHFACKGDHFLHEMILNMQMKTDYRALKNKTVDGDVDEDYSHDGEDNHYHPESLYLLSETEVREALRYLPASSVSEAIENSDLIAAQCNVSLPETRLHMPVFTMPSEAAERLSLTQPEDNRQNLWEMTVQGLRSRLRLSEDEELPEEYQERLEREYEALTGVDLGDGATLGDYFLVNWDWITNFCKSEGILTGPGRGSAGGSLLAYSLGITHIDPIEYDLQFERFWNPGRAAGFPDIDTDVEQGKRQSVKQYLIERYGPDKVLSIGTHIRHQPKSSLDAVALAYFGREFMKAGGYDTVAEIKSIIDELVDAGKQPSWELIWEQRSDKLLPYKHASEDWEAVFELAEKITGRISHYGIHASAVVISDVPLPEVMPCRSATPPKGEKERQLVTQVDMVEVEDIGFLKLDLLGLRNLDTLSLTSRLAGMEEFDWWNDVDYSNLPYELFDEGLTLGLFQVENGRAARDIAKRLKPRSLKDLAAIVALNRPGPLRSGAADRFLDRRSGKAPVLYPHPILEDILEHTYGEMIYQEDVLAYFRKLGYSWEEADQIRYMMGKKKVELMQAELPRYLERAQLFMSEQEALDIWALMEDFSKYGFNLPHAACYGKILAATLYAKGT